MLMAKMYLTEVIVMLLLPLYVAAQRYMLESQPSYLSEVQVCPVTVNITCRADRVLVLRWIAEQDGTLVEFASHSGNVNDVYHIKRSEWTSIDYAQPAIMAYANSEFDINATISIPLIYMIDESISRISCGSSATSRSESFKANATIIGPPPPPLFIRCCTGKPMDPLGSITCNRTSTNETYVNFPLLPNVDMYTVNYDEHLVSTDCLNKQFVTPNMRCKFMQQNESTEYSFSIRAISCNNQESQSSNFTLITAHDGPRPSDVDVSYIYKDDFTLAQIQARWNISDLDCPGVEYTYNVILQNGSTNDVDIFQEKCSSNMACSADFIISSSYVRYKVLIAAIDNQGETVGAPYVSEFIDGVIRNMSGRPSITVMFFHCYTLAICQSSVDGSCVIHISQNSSNVVANSPVMGQVNSSIDLSDFTMNEVYFYRAVFNIGRMIQTEGNLTTTEYDRRLTTANTVLCVIGVIICLLLPIIFLVLTIRRISLNKDDKQKRLLTYLNHFCIVAEILVEMLSVIFWIAVIIVVSRQDDTCSNSWQSAREGLIGTAFGLSCLCILPPIWLFIIIIAEKVKREERSNADIHLKDWEKKECRRVIAVDDLATSGHKHPGERSRDGRTRVAVERMSISMSMETSCSDYNDKTEYTDMTQNKQAQHGSSMYSILEKNVVKSQDCECSSLQHKTARPTDSASGSAAQHGRLNRENAESTGMDSTVNEQYSSEREYASLKKY